MSILKTDCLKLCGLTGLLLLVPLFANQTVEGFNWSLADFLLMAVLLFSFGLAYLVLRSKVNTKYRLVLGVFIVFSFLWLWAELAVGVFTNLGS